MLRQLFDVKTFLRLSQSEKMKTFRLLDNAMAVEARGGKQPSTETVAAALDNLLSSAGSQNVRSKANSTPCWSPWKPANSFVRTTPIANDLSVRFIFFYPLASDVADLPKSGPWRSKGH
jgi:hypothetical protein